MEDKTFDDLVREAQEAHFAGWDFSYLRVRKSVESLPPRWDYGLAVRDAMRGAGSMLDMDTGGGEVLAGFAPLPTHTCATEGYPPNVILARARLDSLGARVVDISADLDSPTMPFEDAEFELITNRHGSFHAPELWRVLRAGGHFVTQQVGGYDTLDLNDWLQGDVAEPQDPWTLRTACRQLRDAGFSILSAEEAFPETTYLDIGAVVYQLRAVPWLVPDFSVGKYHDRLLAMHEHIQAHGGLTIKTPGFYVHAVRP